MNKQKPLDEKGFVFIDRNSKPFHVRMWDGVPWLFYWHPDKRWVSLRQINQSDVWEFFTQAIPDDQAEVYHKFNQEV